MVLRCTQHALQDVQFCDVELPGQYLAGLEVHPDSITYLEGIGAGVAIVRRNASSFRRLSLLCSDGLTRHMLVQVCCCARLMRADEGCATPSLSPFRI